MGELSSAVIIGFLDLFPHAVYFWHRRERPLVRFIDLSNWGSSALYDPKRPIEQT